MQQLLLKATSVKLNRPKRHLPPRSHLPPRHQIHYLLASHHPSLLVSQLRGNLPRFLLDCLCMATVQHALQCITQFIAVHGGCVLAIAPDAYAEVFDAVGEVVGVDPDGEDYLGNSGSFSVSIV